MFPPIGFLRSREFGRRRQAELIANAVNETGAAPTRSLAQRIEDRAKELEAKHPHRDPTHPSRKTAKMIWAEERANRRARRASNDGAPGLHQGRKPGTNNSTFE